MSRNKGGNTKETALQMVRCSACETEALALPGRHRKCPIKKDTRQIEWRSEKTNVSAVREEGGGPRGRWSGVTKK